MISAGQYEGKAIKGKVQLGETPTGTLQIAIDMELFDKGQSVGSMTTFLYFSDASAVYSYERLRLLGWIGAGPEDIDKLDGIFENRVPCQVTAPAPYRDPKDGSQKMGASKLEILAGSGTVVLNKPLDAGTFKARLRAIGGGGGSTPTTGGGGTAPPF
jgi:hypothetical protein